MDETATSRDFEQYHAELLRFLRPRLGPHASRDVAQEAYLRLLQVRSTSPIRDVRAFLFAVASNIASDRERHARRWRTVQIETPEAEYSLPLAPATDRVAAGEEELRNLAQAVKDLPAKCRAALIMLRIEGLTFRQIARQLNCSETMARKYAAKALEYCYSRLEREDQ